MAVISFSLDINVAVLHIDMSSNSHMQMIDTYQVEVPIHFGNPSRNGNEDCNKTQIYMYITQYEDLAMKQRACAPIAI